MIEQNPLDLLDVSLPTGRDFPTRPSDSGWFSDDLNFNPQTLLPAMAEALGRVSEVRRALSQPSCSRFLVYEVGESRAVGLATRAGAASVRRGVL